MSGGGVDPSVLLAWLSGRSIARGVPSPVPAFGGFRVDTNSDAEISRWVFPAMCSGLKELGRSIDEPRYSLKLCGTVDELAAVLPPRWQIDAPNYFMEARGDDAGGSRPLTEGYRLDVRREGPLVEVRIWSDADMLAASGYAGETPEAFVYDRIVVAPAHRRKGLGRAMMAALRAAGRERANRELLVATGDGRALYSSLGWRTISPYATASIAASIAASGPAA